MHEKIKYFQSHNELTHSTQFCNPFHSLSYQKFLWHKRSHKSVPFLVLFSGILKTMHSNRGRLVFFFLIAWSYIVKWYHSMTIIIEWYFVLLLIIVHIAMSDNRNQNKRASSGWSMVGVLTETWLHLFPLLFFAPSLHQLISSWCPLDIKCKNLKNDKWKSLSNSYNRPSVCSDCLFVCLCIHSFIYFGV